MRQSNLHSCIQYMYIILAQTFLFFFFFFLLHMRVIIPMHAKSFSTVQSTNTLTRLARAPRPSQWPTSGSICSDGRSLRNCNRDQSSLGEPRHASLSVEPGLPSAVPVRHRVLRTLLLLCCSLSCFFFRPRQPLLIVGVQRQLIVLVRSDHVPTMLRSIRDIY